MSNVNSCNGIALNGGKYFTDEVLIQESRDNKSIIIEDTLYVDVFRLIFNHIKVGNPRSKRYTN